VAYSSSLLIEELNSTGDSVQRSVTLQGPGLPFMGAAWSGKMAMKTTWYPGNGDEATQTLTGPQDMPSDWKGEWNRTRMIRSPSIVVDESGAVTQAVSPETLVDALEAMFREGARLRVTWAVTGDSPGASVRKVREGRASQWVFTYTRAQDIEWSVTYEWVGRGRATQKVVSTRDDNLDASVAALNVSVSNLAALIDANKFINANGIRLAAHHLTLGQLEAFVGAPLAAVNSLRRNLQSIVNDVKRIGDIAQKVRGLPFAIASQAVDFARNTVGLANQFVDQISRTPPEQMTLKQDVSSLTRALGFYNQNKQTSRLVARQAQDFALKMRTRQASVALQGTPTNQSVQMRTGDVQAVYVTKQGDTPQRVSQRFYKTPDHARDILRANRLPLSQPTLPPGKPIIIPFIQTTQRGA
jgi:hypothetical protein